MLSTCPLKVVPPYASTVDRRRAGRAACAASCVSLKFAVTQTSSSCDERHQRLPGWTTWPGLTLFFDDDALGRRLHDGVLEVQLGLRQRRLRLLDARLRRRRARAHGRAPVRAPVCARCAAPRAPGVRRRAPASEPALGHADAGFALRRSALRAVVDGGVLRVGRRDGRVELLLRDFVLGQQAAQPFDVARGARGVGLGLAQTRPAPPPAAPAPLRRPASGFVMALSRLIQRALRRAHVARRRRRRDRHVALRRDRRGLGVGQLRARLVDRDLVVARIDLHEHRARLDRLVVGDRRPAAPSRRRAPRSASHARRPAHRRSTRGRAVIHNQAPTRDHDERGRRP